MSARIPEIAHVSKKLIASDNYGIGALRAELDIAVHLDPVLIEANPYNRKVLSNTAIDRLGLTRHNRSRLNEPIFQFPGISQEGTVLPRANLVVINDIKNRIRREVAEIRANALFYAVDERPEFYQRRLDYFRGKEVDTYLLDTEQILLAGFLTYTTAEVRAKQMGLQGQETLPFHRQVIDARVTNIMGVARHNGLSERVAEDEANFHPTVRGHEFFYENIDYLMSEQGYSYDRSFRFIFMSVDQIGPHIDEGATFAQEVMSRIDSNSNEPPGL